MTEENYNPDHPYTNREIREKWHDIANVSQEILLQTKRTNGSVADINQWRERVNGAGMASAAFMAFVVMPILAWSLYTLITIKDTVHNAVDQALQAYDIVKQ